MSYQIITKLPYYDYHIRDICLKWKCNNDTAGVHIVNLEEKTADGRIVYFHLLDDIRKYGEIYAYKKGWVSEEQMVRAYKKANKEKLWDVGYTSSNPLGMRE